MRKVSSRCMRGDFFHRSDSINSKVKKEKVADWIGFEIISTNNNHRKTKVCRNEYCAF